MLTKKTLPSRFVFTGFSSDQHFRQYAFDGIEEDHSRTPFTVRVDPALARAYGIRFQDLPLLCREFLDRRAVTEDARRQTFAEEDMRLCQAERLAAQQVAARKRRPPTPRPSTGNTERLAVHASEHAAR